MWGKSSALAIIIENKDSMSIFDQVLESSEFYEEIFTSKKKMIAEPDRWQMGKLRGIKLITNKVKNLVCKLTALEAHFVPLESTGNAFLRGVHGFAAFRALGVFNGLERHFVYSVKKFLRNAMDEKEKRNRKNKIKNGSRVSE